MIHDRTDSVGPELRDYAERRVTRLARHFDRVQLVQVDFEQERNRSQEPERVVTILLQTDSRKGPQTLKARERALDSHAALDLALDKLDRQVRKLKEKLKVRKARTAATEEPLPRATSEGPERLRVHLRPESLQQATESLHANGHLFHLFLDEDTGEVNVIYRRHDGAIAIIEPTIS